MDAPAAPLVPGTQYRVAPRSVAVLFARTADTSVPDEGLSATQVPTQIDVPVNQPR